jgi:hypothetical protein
MVSSTVTTQRLRSAGARSGTQVATYANRLVRASTQHRTELLFLAVTLGFALVAGVLGALALPTF